MRGILSKVVILLVGFGDVAAAQGYDGIFEKLTPPYLSLMDAIAKAKLESGGSGVVFEAELESEAGRIVYSIDIAQGDKVLNVVIDAKGAVVSKETEDEDHSVVAAAARIPLHDAIRTAIAKAGEGRQAVHGRLAMRGDKPEARVLLFGGGKGTIVVIDEAGGAVLSIEAQAASAPDSDELDERFTDSFGEEPADLGPTGANPYFILDPGWFIELSGKKGEDEVVILITVLDVTRKIAGVCCRAVEEKEIVNGQIKESTRDYFAISRKTNNVYYFGEDVDVYKDGKVVGHEGTWIAGEKGARYGLFMPGVPLLGARYYQEIAPGVALDRGEVTSLTEKLECPAGKFENVLKVVETSDLEKDVAETNLYARGIGVVMDDDLKLSKYGKKR
jgi:hypothetical protein